MRAMGVWAWVLHVDFGTFPCMSSLFVVVLGSLTMLLDSSLFMMDITIVARLFSVIVLDFRACSWFWLLKTNSDSCCLNSA
jgi:intracellular septation protein A